MLPLINRRRKVFSATGLIVGSIIPDFESFIRFDQHKAYSHTWLGVLWFDLPLAVIYAFIFQNIVRDPLIRNLPGNLSNRFSAYIGFNWNGFFRKHFIIVICSILIGIVSHLLWDALTHLNLADPNAIDSQVYIGPVRLYILLQYVSSVVGLAIVMWYVLTFKGKPVVEQDVSSSKSKAPYWILVGIIACLTVAISSMLIDEPLNAILFIEISISGLLLATILTPLVFGKLTI